MRMRSWVTTAFLVMVGAALASPTLVTAGMPTVFTTPTHGTAYHIVGQGKTNPGALKSAFDIAVRLAAARRH